MKPDRPSPDNGPIPREVKLAVKDALREVRQNLRQGGRSLASQVRSTVDRLDDTAAPLHLPRLGEPLGEVARQAARLIQGADRVAQDFFNNDAQYRSLGFRLRPVADYLADDGGRPATAKPFTKALFWAIRHLVELSGSQDVVVYEQAIHRTWQRLVDAARTEFPRDASSTARSRLAASLVIEELCRQDEPPLLRILGEPKAAPEDEDACKRRAAALALQCSAAAILAGEIADRVAAPSPEAATRTALAQAREIVAGRHAAWQAAFDGKARRQDLAAELALVTSHF